MMNTELNEFQKSFTNEQRIAVFCCLMLAAKSDGPVNEAEMQSIGISARTIGLDMENSVPEIRMMASKGSAYMTSILNTLSESQKEWYIIAMHTIVQTDHSVVLAEMNECLQIAKEIGISEMRYKNILDKMDGIYDAFFNK